MWVVTRSDRNWSPVEQTFLNRSISENYPGHIILEDPTVTYNCHGYTFGVIQGSERYNITWSEDLCTGAFNLVTTPQIGDIAVIRYTNSSQPDSPHSSLVYSQDTMISKWGDGPLTKHHKDNLIGIPAYASGQAYYTYYRRINNTITGPSVFDGSDSYTFTPTPNVTPTSCTWSVEPAAMFQTSSGSGYTANLTYKTPLTYLAHKAIITFTFYYSCDNYYSVSKEINLFIPTTTISGTAISDGFIIDTNAIVTVTGEIRTNIGAKTIVPTGTKLVIDGGCMKGNGNAMWPGIEVWGNSNTHQFTLNGNCGQGQLELRNGAVIENAVCAVELWRPGFLSTTGGIVNADSAVFRNNAKAVHALHYTNHYPTTGGESPYKASFHNCTFTIDGNYLGTAMFHRHIDLNDVNGVQFSGCSFSIGSNASNVSNSNCGIGANNAGFLVSGYCTDNVSHPHSCPQQYLVRCSFTGFRYAVSSIHDGSNARSFTVRDASFNNNEFGIYAINTGYATVLDNIFNIGTTSDCSFGIFADGVTQFCIEENTFQPYGTGGGDTYGIGIINSCRSNDVYLNTFDNLTCGNLAVGTNTSKNLASNRTSKIDGLTYHCNQNSGNDIDFYVLREDGNGGILPLQGSASTPAGNTFDGSSYHFYNDGDDVIDYYYNSNASHEVPDASLLYRMNRIATTNQNNCNTHYGTVTKSDDEKSALESEYLTAWGIYSNLMALYMRRIDGGNTTAEVTDLLTASPSDQKRLRDKLLRHSPYLSQEVLSATAERYDIFSDLDIFDILAANPDELKKDTLIRYLENNTHPLPNYMIDLLQQMASGVTERTALVAQMAKYRHEYSIAAGDIIRSDLNDSVANPQELRTWLGNMDDISSDRMAIASYMQENDYENAFELANLLPDLYEMNASELEDHSDYMRLLTLYRTLHESNRTTAQMTDCESRMVDSIATQGHGVSQSMAKAIIIGNSGEPGTRYACPDIPRPNRTKGYSSIDKNETSEFSVTITPNPARSQASVIYTLPNETSHASLVFTNTLGIQVISTELEGDCGEKTINFGELPSGIYSYTARCGNSVLNGKTMVTH